MAFPITYDAVGKIVRHTVLHTQMARRIVSRSGFRAGSGDAGPAAGGRPPITILRYEFFNLQLGVTYDTGQTPLPQYSRTLSRKYALTIPANATRGLQRTGSTGRLSSHMTKIWLGPFTEVRVVARAISSTSSLHAIAAFAHPSTGDWMNSPVFSAAGFADTAQNVLTGTGSAIVPFTTPISASTWQDIHATYKTLGEVRAGLFLRNTSLTTAPAPETGVLELQVR